MEKQMSMKGITPYAQVCLETWINCENLLSEISLRQTSYSHRLEKTLDECAHICMEAWQALKGNPAEAKDVVLLCMGICEECAEACSRYHDDWFRQCAQACRKCANRLADATLQSALYQ